MPLDPIKNQGVGLFWHLPEKSVRLALQDFELRGRDALCQYFGLRHMVAPDRVSFADNHQRRRFDIAETVGPFPVVARDAEMDKLRKLGMGCPEEFEETLHFVGMAIAIVLCEKG